MIFYYLDLNALAEANAHQKNESNQWLRISKSAAKEALKQPNLRLIDDAKIVKVEQV